MIPFYFARRRRRVFNAPRRFQQLRRTVSSFLALAAGVALLHALAMMAFEGLSFRQAVWLTATTIVTVGYGDLAAKTAFGQVSTMVLLYAAGIFLAAQGASAWFDYRIARRDAMARGEWDWSKTLKDHVIIVAPGRVGELFLVRLVVELDHHAATRGLNVVVVSDEFREGLSAALVAGDVKFVSGLGNDPEALAHAGVARSAYVIVLANDPDAALSDSLSFDIVSRVREVNQRCEVISQCVDDRNRAHLLAAGANVVMRPVRGYPEIIVTSLLNPGSMEVLANLFSGAGERIELVRGSFRGTWVTLVNDMLQRDAGLPIAVRLTGGRVLTAPRAQEMIDAEGLYVLVSSAKDNE
jgi:voltage-gated potassium channel